MKITEIRINKYENGNTLGFASVTFDNLLCVTGITILKGKEDTKFISFPQNKGKDDTYHDIVFPITKEGRKAITEKVLKAYEEVEEVPFS